MKLSGITVSFKRTKQVQQFEPASAEVTLNYVAEDDEAVHENAIGIALAMAKQQVAEALGLKSAPTTASIAPGAKIEIGVEAVKTEPNPTPAVESPSVSPPIAPKSDTTAEKKPRGRPPKKQVDPAAMEDATVVEASTVNTSDPAAMEEPVAPVPGPIAYTVADLSKAVTAQMGALAKAKVPDAGKKIMAYLATWKADPNVIMTGNQIQAAIPEDKRAAFIDGLKEVG